MPKCNSELPLDLYCCSRCKSIVYTSTTQNLEIISSAFFVENIKFSRLFSHLNENASIVLLHYKLIYFFNPINKHFF